MTAEMSEAVKKPNSTTRHLRQYPVSDKDVAKPVKPDKKKDEKKVVAEGSGPKEKQKTPYRDINSPEYRKAADKQKQQMAKDAAAEPGKKLADKIAKKGVAEAAFKDPSPMMKDSIKQDKIRSLKNLIAIAKVKGVHHKVKEYESELKKLKEMAEETEYLEEKNKPTNPELWSRAVSMARSKFDVYPSAYANGWAAKWYKSKGGGWKSVSEAYNTMSPSSYDDYPMVAFRKKQNEKKKEDPPFDPPYKTVKKDVVDKSGAKHGPMSIAKHLAKTAAQKQATAKKPLKESRKAEIVKEIVKKKKDEKAKDKFEANPTLSSEVMKD